MQCHTCQAEITDHYHARPEHFRGTTRWHCGDVQACAERSTALRLGIPISVQHAYFAAVERGLWTAPMAELVG